MPGVEIPQRLLLALCPFAGGLTAQQAVAALACGVRAGGMAEPDRCPIDDGRLPADFDARLRRARALVVGDWRLDRAGLRGSPVFELATRARQAGVPAYAVTGTNELDAFDARMLDLQVVLEAKGARGLSAAGRKLAAIA
jgi:glycerate kinase